jgi:hypothetical protein
VLDVAEAKSIELAVSHLMKFIHLVVVVPSESSVNTSCFQYAASRRAM